MVYDTTVPSVPVFGATVVELPMFASNPRRSVYVCPPDFGMFGKHPCKTGMYEVLCEVMLLVRTYVSSYVN